MAFPHRHNALWSYSMIATRHEFHWFVVFLGLPQRVVSIFIRAITRILRYGCLTVTTTCCEWFYKQMLRKKSLHYLNKNTNIMRIKITLFLFCLVLLLQTKLLQSNELITIKNNYIKPVNTQTM